MKRLVVGVIGHVDHGKTALVRALTGMETDRLAEEKRRGISIALGFAHFAPEPGIVIDLVDMPGHERYVRTMIGGATGMDGALLVIAANEGICRQTREHAQVAAVLGIRRVVLAISKCDLADSGNSAKIASQATEFISDIGLDVEACVMTSSATGQGMGALAGALAGMVYNVQPRADDGIAFMPLDRVFAVPGHGPVVTGTLRGAALSAGDRLLLLPQGREVRLRSLQCHGRTAEKVAPGQRLAANLRGVAMRDLSRGMALCAPDALAPTRWLALCLKALADAPPLRNGMAVRVAYGATEVAARLRLLDRGQLEAGLSCMAQVHLAEAVWLPAGEHLVLRQPDLSQTLGGGKVLDTSDRRLKRNSDSELERLEYIATKPLEYIVEKEIESAGKAGMPLSSLVRLTAKAPWRLAQAIAATSGQVNRSGMVHGASEVRRRLAIKAQPLQSSAPPDDAALAASLRAAGLNPPTPRELMADPAAAAAINRLLRRGVLVRTADRDKGKELFFHADAIAFARQNLAPLLAAGTGLTVSQIAAALGISRKFTMPLLDHLDSARFTLRSGDLRHLHPDHAPGR